MDIKERIDELTEAEAKAALLGLIDILVVPYCSRWKRYKKSDYDKAANDVLDGAIREARHEKVAD